MNNTILVLANFADAEEATARYASILGGALHLHLPLLHLEMNPVMPELVAAPAGHTNARGLKP